MELVTVIIPSHNRAGYIGRALKSAINQTYQNLEILVIDDGSTDETEQVVKSFKGNISYFWYPRGGVSKARNRGIGHAKGKWITFLDSDDEWLPQKLERQILFLNNHPEFRLCHTDEIWIKNGVRINQGKKHKKYSGWFFEPSLKMCVISPSSVCIDRSIFDTIGTFDESFPWVEDYELWLRITAHYPVGYIDEKLVIKYGGHNDQLSKRIDGIEKYRILALEKLLLEGNLPERYVQTAWDTYRYKCEIYIQGCNKRGKMEEISRIKAQIERISTKLFGEKILN